MRRWVAVLALAPVLGLAQPDHSHEEPKDVGRLAPPGERRAGQIYDMYDNEIALRADRYYHDGQYHEVISLLTIRLGANPRDGSINSDLVFYLRSTGRFDLAITQSLRFRSTNPVDEVGVETEADIYRYQKLWDRIPPILEPFLPTTRSIGIFVMLMKSYEEMGLINEAIRVVETRLQRSPDDRSALVNLNRLKEKLKGGNVRDEQATDYGTRHREKGIFFIAKRLQHC